MFNLDKETNEENSVTLGIFLPKSLEKLTIESLANIIKLIEIEYEINFEYLNISGQLHTVNFVKKALNILKAEGNNKGYVEFSPDYVKHKSNALIVRNNEIISNSTMVLSIDEAIDKGKYKISMLFEYNSENDELHSNF